MSELRIFQKLPVWGPDGEQIGEATVTRISSDGRVEARVDVDRPVPEWLEADVNLVSIAQNEPSDPLFPVVITQVIERVVWVRACAADHATDIVAEDAAERFASDRSSPYQGPFYDVRVTTPEMVPPTLPEKT